MSRRLELALLEGTMQLVLGGRSSYGIVRVLTGVLGRVGGVGAGNGVVVLFVERSA